MNHRNTWANPSGAGAADVVQMAAFLETRSRDSDLVEINNKLCDLAAARPGEYLLEVGSGSGVLCRLLAGRVQPHGCVVGVDISPEMSAEARKYALAAGVEESLAFQAGAAEALPYPDAAYDGAIAARLLLHTPQPAIVLREMARVVRSGGRVLVMDWDFDTVAVDHPNRELTRRLLHWRSDHHGGNNWSGRQLRRLMREAGLHDLSVHPWVTVADSEAQGLTQSLWRAAQVAREGGAITLAEHDAWVNELKDRIRAGTFFASIVYFIVRGTVALDHKPAR